jgi:hypothetical protein
MPHHSFRIIRFLSARTQKLALEVTADIPLSTGTDARGGSPYYAGSASKRQPRQAEERDAREK